ncbi:MAG: response regulator transcription factor [Edaphobacter sp.]|uniref:response regulator transcription factor n=1 Tax=Edaphobacter sp. TaxID=1934404 RepID=UPI002399C788|nr:response regulator transcription factor [Edaphobacter sp.]MDE1177438.1 response regulator transcription factor [Edaphobacter sp.]
MNVLVIEDDKRIAVVLQQSLAEDGHNVFLSHRGDEGMDLITSDQFDVVVLDIMLPAIDGFTILSKVRAKRLQIPILMLTARGDMPNMVRGLDLGADDYLTKPFQLDNFLARVRAIGRRGHNASDNNITVGSLILNQAQQILRRDGEEVALTRKEFLILDLLMRRMNKVVTRDQMISAGWGFDADVSDNSIDFYISSLRSKIDTKGQPSLIRTMRSIGYCFSTSSVSQPSIA